MPRASIAGDSASSVISDLEGVASSAPRAHDELAQLFHPQNQARDRADREHLEEVDGNRVKHLAKRSKEDDRDMEKVASDEPGDEPAVRQDAEVQCRAPLRTAV